MINIKNYLYKFYIKIVFLPPVTCTVTRTDDCAAGRLRSKYRRATMHHIFLYMEEPAGIVCLEKVVAPLHPFLCKARIVFSS